MTTSLTEPDSSVNAPRIPHGAVRVLDLRDELVVRTRQQFKQRVLDAIHAGDRKFIVDFSGCAYVDSSGLGVLVSIAKKIREADPGPNLVRGELVLCGLNEDLRTLFDLTGMSPLFAFASSVSDAMRWAYPTRKLA